METIDCAEQPVNSVSWARSGDRLLAGGTVLTLWADRALMGELPALLEEHAGASQCAAAGTMVVVWTAALASPVDHVAFAPDDRLFVSLGGEDCRPKVWFAREAEVTALLPGHLQFDFVYLPHPCAVVACSWREAPLLAGSSSAGSSVSRPQAHVLMTSARDNVCRLWAESAPTEAASMRICGTMSPPEPFIASSAANADEPLVHHWLLNPPPDSAPEEAAVTTEAAATPVTPASPSTVSRSSASSDVLMAASPQRAMREATALARLRTPSGHSVQGAEAVAHVPLPGVGHRTTTPSTRQREDVVFCIFPDGSLVLWRIDHLDSVPQRIPRVSLSSRMPQVG